MELDKDAGDGQVMVPMVIGDYRKLRKEVRACLD